MKRTTFVIGCIMMLSACSNKEYEVTDKGVIVDVPAVQNTDAKKVRIEVMGEKLMHVSATPDLPIPRA